MVIGQDRVMDKAGPALTLAILAAIANLAAPASALAGPRLSVTISGAAQGTLSGGVANLANGALAYRPASLPPGPRPLLVLLHGAGEPPQLLLDAARASADRKGLILVAPGSAGETWDAIEMARAARVLPTGRRAEEAFGPDPQRVDQAIREIAARAQIDRSRVIVAGHSDGASYALSLGLWNPRLFHGIIALSPGGLLAPDDKPRSQRIFIAHGRGDWVVSIVHDQQSIAEPLTAAGLNVRFRSFNGGHAVDVASLDEGIDYVLR
jgi:predicted esterase